ncbi:PilW family protein [Neisseria wadsworthii]|nr:hypothetical protein [Neisseria wadsworthii]
MKKNIYINKYIIKPKGFSIIEFMVASLLSMIILIAVGSGYFAARKVNDVAIARLNAQQDIRNVSNMIVYDARMAGGFGCFNLSNLNVAKNITVATDWSGLNNKDIRNLHEYLFSGTKGADNAVELSEGVKTISQSDFASVVTGIPGGFVAQSDALVFQYGEGTAAVADLAATRDELTIHQNDDATVATLVDNSPVVVSTCNTLSLYVIKRPNSGNVFKLGPKSQGLLPEAIMAPEVRHEVSLTRYIVNIYVVGRPNGGELGLYRIRFGNNAWEAPQLLLSGINKMNILYGYVNGCPGIDPTVNSELPAASAPEETFTFTEQPLTTDMARPLASIRLRLNGNNLAAEGQTMTNAASRESAGNVYIYNIDANVRGGNRCANR